MGVDQIIRILKKIAKSRFAYLKCFLGVMPFGNILYSADHFNRHAGAVIVDRLGLAAEQPDSTVRQDDPGFEVEESPCKYRFAKTLTDAFAVVRMNSVVDE